MWDELITSELENRRQKSHEGGGAERTAKQHSLGKLTARERLGLLFDDGKFNELYSLAKPQMRMTGLGNKAFWGDGVIVGFGKVNDRIVYAAAQDFTVCGGSLGVLHAEKICRIMDMALKARAPFVSINDGGGARIQEGIAALDGYGKIFKRNVEASGTIPQISAVMGPCAGGACYSPALSDFIFITEQNGQMYITGPEVIKMATGEKVDFANLGGAVVHSEQSGVAHFTCPDDCSCIAQIRKLLSYLPDNCNSWPPVSNNDLTVSDSTATIEIKEVPDGKRLCDIVPTDIKRAYNMQEVIRVLADQDSFLEIQPSFARNIIIGLCRLDGRVIGVVANQPAYLSGALDCDSSDKAARFIRFCDCFNIPLLSLVDVPAYLPGSMQEHKGIIRHGAKLIYAFAESSVPKICLILRKAFGGAYIAMNSRSIGADIVYTWPTAQIAVMGTQGAVRIIGHGIADGQEGDVERKRLADQYNREFMGPYAAAEGGFADEVILPEETPQRLRKDFMALTARRFLSQTNKHGNIPL